MSNKFFPGKPDVNPRIYAYEDTNPEYKGLLKVGYTARNVHDRIAQQYPTKRPGKPPYKIVLDESAMRNDGTLFTDRHVHRRLKKQGILNPDGEWFKCKVKDVQASIMALSNSEEGLEGRHQNFSMRPEQIDAVQKTISYFQSFKADATGKSPRFLWNAKMRFGKTFTAYQLAKKMEWSKILVLTFKPAVQSAWEEDLTTHIDFMDWQFISRGGLTFEEADKSKPIVCFGSFQDYLGKNRAGGIKPKNEWVHTTNWDCVILDEYHYGAWREDAQELFENEDKKENAFAKGLGIDDFDEDIMPITTYAYLYLSGTPFRALESGEFIEEQIFNWTYSDEQTAKSNWPGGNNPYASLPRMVLMTYQLPDSIREVAMGGEFDEFDLSTFFSANGKNEDARFTYENEVQKWLDLIRGAYLETTMDDLKLGAHKPPLPFSDTRLLNVLNHTFWFLPNVASCFAMKNLIEQRQNTFYQDYKVVVAAGDDAGIGVKALPPVLNSMNDPLKSKTITLTCQKLIHGVSVKPWTAIFMLRNLSTPETYFQAAFRVQTPWVIENPDGKSPNQQQVIKQECYVFDFAPDRALRRIVDYSCRLNIGETNPEEKIEDFIKFLPVLAYDGSSMKQVDAADVLEIAMSGTSATLLARRWQSPSLVKVDNATLSRLMGNERVMKALMSIEGFRSLNQDIQTIINRAESIKKAKTKANHGDLSSKEKKQLTEDEKEYKSKRKLIQNQLIKLAARLPIFMYLTDHRELTLTDVITNFEPELFYKVTGISVDIFEELLSLDAFNNSRMNGGVYNFKRYEDASLRYTGISKHTGLIGLWNTVVNDSDVITAV